MKRVSLLFSAFLLIGMLFSTQVMGQGHINLSGAKSAQECLNVTDDGFTATFSFSSIDAAEVTTERGVFSNITMDGTFPTGKIGEPTIPSANKLIAVPFGATDVTVDVKSYTTEVYKLSDYNINQLDPMQPLLRKDQKPEDIPFEYKADVYARQGYAERPIAQFQIEGTMRGIQVAALTVNPIQYDAANNTIRVYNDIEIEVSYGRYDKAAAYDEFARTFNPYFIGIYKQMFNSRAINDIYDEHPDLWQNPVKMLVIANRAFESTIQDWVTWKTEKGFYVDVNYTDEIGSNANAIKTFIQNKYNEDAPTFLMIMGDKNMVPESATGNQTSCVTDLYYMSVDGDEFPDMFHSRFPAENASQMTAMLNKALEYEQLTMPDPSYLSKVLLIAGADSSGWGVEVGRPTIWYASNYYYNTEHGFTDVYEYSHGTYTGCYNNFNTGVGFANYTAHGSNTSWSDPSFTVSNVNSLTNEHKYFLAMGNCCQAADWGINGASFGEAMVRAENKGAYAYIGSCPSTYWLNDYYFGVGATTQHNGQMPDISITTMGCYDAIWDDDAYNTVEAIKFIGNLAGNAAGALGYELHKNTLYYWQAYHTLGDGSILPFRVAPTDNEVSHLPTLPIGMDFYTVTAAPGSYVGISKDGELVGAGMIDESGTTDITIVPVTSGGNVKIVVTHPQHVPYIAEVPAAAMTGAYVAVDQYALNVEQANYGETVDLDITLKNVGTLAASNLTATLSTECEYVEILTAEGTVANLEPDETFTMEGFQFAVAENVPDNTKAQFVLDVTDGTDTWSANINITLHAPKIECESIVLTPGFNNTSYATLTFKNNGSAPFEGGQLTVLSCSPELTISPEETTFEDVVEAGETKVFQIEYAFDENVPNGISYQVSYNLTSGLQVAEGIFCIDRGTVTEGFEEGVFGEGWTVSNQNPWQVVSGGRGNFCAKSNNNGQHSSEGYMQYTLTVYADFQMSFMYKVSSESNYDKLHFFVDDQEKGVWSGTVNWTRMSETLAPGTHTLKWSYTKDVSVSSGEDCAWVDDIVLPPTSIVTFLTPATNLEAMVDGHNVTLTWTASEEADAYLIKRNGETLETVTETTYEDFIEEITEDEYVYSVYALNGDQISAPITTTVVFDVTGVAENQKVKVTVYPNPANDVLTINTDANNFKYQLVNSIGQVVRSGNASNNAVIKVSELNKGIYFLRIDTGNAVNTKKVVVE